MKDVISILQSRIAIRENEITVAEESLCYCPLCRADGAYAEQREEIVHLAKQQKEDKRILAEIVKLRREVKDEQAGRKDLHDMHLCVLEKHSKYIKLLHEQLKKETLDVIMSVWDSAYEPAEVKLPKDFVELIRLGER